MCGLTGLLRFDSQRIERHYFQEFNDSLSHRGPDHGDCFFEDDGAFALGHRRLSIIDLDPRSHQPMSSLDGRYIIAFNGEIYNYIELKKELISKGYTFFSESDTEVLLNAFEHWGLDCMHRFNGMWAFAIWDRQKQELVVARDRFGVKPLYFLSQPHFFAFASEQKAFKYLQNFELVLNPEMCGLSLANKGLIESFRETIYSHVSRLLAGEYLVIDKNGKSKSYQWWDTVSEMATVSEEDCKPENLKELFLDACKIRSRADVKLASSLSGGLDSSSVTSALAHLNIGCTAFIGCFEDNKFDESPYAKEVTDAYQVNHQLIHIDSEDLESTILASVYGSEEILAEPMLGPWSIHRAQSLSGFKISLEGHGGDELYGGYYHHVKAFIGDRILQKDLLPDLAHAIVTCDEMLASFPEYRVQAIREHILQSTAETSPLNRHMPFVGLFKPGMDHLNASPVKSVKTAGNSLFFNRLYWDFHFGCLLSNLRDFDRSSMANSVEVRAPFMDWRLVLASFKAPNSVKFERGRTKNLIRSSFDFVPESIRNRKSKLGFNSPLDSWSHTLLREWWLDIINSREFLEFSLINGPAVRDKLEEEVKQKASVSRYWPLMNMFLLDKLLSKA